MAKMNTASGRFLRGMFLSASVVYMAALPAALMLRAEPLLGPEMGEERARAIVMIGPPGAGKSEQGRRMAARRGIPVISTGDLLRDHVKRGTSLGQQADAFMKAGKLVPDSLMTPILEDRLSQPDCARGFILDGYPRTLAQAEKLDLLLKKKGLPQDVLLLDVSAERVLKLLAGRRVCPACNRSYNVYFQPPQKEGVCDADATPLVQRPDDKEEVIRRRLETYRRETQPAIDYYVAQRRLIRIDGAQTPEKVAAEIESKLAAQQ